jgi:hypothetical protein
MDGITNRHIPRRMQKYKAYRKHTQTTAKSPTVGMCCWTIPNFIYKHGTVQKDQNRIRSKSISQRLPTAERPVTVHSDRAKVKGKSYPCNRPWRPIGLRDVEASTFSRQSAHRWRWGCQPYALVTFYAQEDSWYSFLLEAESNPGPYCGLNVYVNWEIQWPNRDSNWRPSGL